MIKGVFKCRILINSTINRFFTPPNQDAFLIIPVFFFALVLRLGVFSLDTGLCFLMVLSADPADSFLFAMLTFVNGNMTFAWINKYRGGGTPNPSVHVTAWKRRKSVSYSTGKGDAFITPHPYYFLWFHRAAVHVYYGEVPSRCAPSGSASNMAASHLIIYLLSISDFEKPDNIVVLVQPFSPDKMQLCPRDWI